MGDRCSLRIDLLLMLPFQYRDLFQTFQWFQTFQLFRSFNSRMGSVVRSNR